MESSLKNMILTLFCITLIAAGALGLVYGLTKEPIAAAKSAKTTGALSDVMEKFDNYPAADKQELEIGGLPVTVYTGRTGNNVTGYAVESITKMGFSGEVKIMVGFKPDGEIYNIAVLEQNETPGLGSKMADEGNPLIVSFKGKNPADLKMSVTKDGGDIDIITASTISSRAYVDAVQRAYDAFREVALGEATGPDLADIAAAVMPEGFKVQAQYEMSNDGKNMTVFMAADSDGSVTSAVLAHSDNAYNGRIVLMVGFAPDGKVNDIAVVEQSETPNFGGVIVNEDNALKQSFIGHTLPARRGDGFGGEVNAITGSTYTTNAYVEAVLRAGEMFHAIKEEGVK